MEIVRFLSPNRVAVLCRVEDAMAVPIALAPPLVGADALRDLLSSHHDADSLRDLDPVADPFPVDTGCVRSPLTSPCKIIGVGLNYADHARESGMDPPSSPVIFSKFPNALVGDREPIHWRARHSKEVDYEAELAVVVGRSVRDVEVDAALNHVFGYAAANDVSARDAQFADGQWVRGKSFDSFLPLGPIRTADEVPDPQSLPISCSLNGKVMQDSSTAEMLFSIAELISFLSKVMRLEPGDVILTGTPAGVGFSRTPPVYLQHGDVVEVSIGGVGSVTNPVAIET